MKDEHFLPSQNEPAKGANGAESHCDRARAALQKHLAKSASETALTQRQIVERYKPFLLEEIRSGVKIIDIIAVLKGLDEPIKPEGFRSALRKTLGRVEDIRARVEISRNTEIVPVQPYPAKRRNPFIHRSHDGEGA